MADGMDGWAMTKQDEAGLLGKSRRSSAKATRTAADVKSKIRNHFMQLATRAFGNWLRRDG
jgi:oligoribonuclease (3'-5' exoribonuclease)